MSSTGSESLRVVGGDTLVRQNTGDDAPEVTVAPFGGEVVPAVAEWLDDNGYAASFLLGTLPTPGLTAAERELLHASLWQSIWVAGDQEAVVERLCLRDDRDRVRTALARPAAPAGERLYTVLRAVVAGDEPVDTVLAELV